MGVADRLKQGQSMMAKVMRVTEFGAFMELAPGLDGLLHISEMASLKNGAPAGAATKIPAGVKTGDMLNITIIKVDEARRRVSLGLVMADVPVAEKIPPPAPAKIGETVKGKVERVEKFGVFVRFGPGRTGMIPNKELGTARGADHRRMFPVGMELTAEVIESDPGGRKIRLSVTKAAGREERDAVDKYKKDATKSGSGSFSTLADAFLAMKDSARKPS